MPQKTFDDESTFVKEKAQCRRQQAIIYVSVNPDLRQQMASLGHNELFRVVNDRMGNKHSAGHDQI